MRFALPFWKRKNVHGCKKQCDCRHSKSLASRSLQVEPLEKRELLAVCTWTGGGGNNLWSTAANWQGGAVPLAGDDLVFQGTTRTVTQNDLTAGTSFRSIEFSGNDCSISGNALTLTSSITVGSGVSGSAISANIALSGAVGFAVAGDLSVSGGLSGSGSLAKSGSGILSLSATDTYTGGTTISAGAVSFVSGGLGSSGTISVTGNSTLQWAGTNTQDISSRLAISNGVNATLDIANTVTFASAFGGTGSGAITKAGSGTLIVISTNSYTGGTTINAGTLQVGAGSSTGSLGAGAITNNSSLVLNSTGSFTVSNAISGTGSLTKVGSGTIYLTGNNTYSGTTTISGGVLFLGNNTTTGSLGSGDVVNNGELALCRTSSMTVSNNISGSGILTKWSWNTAILTGSNNYSGTTRVYDGTLQVGAGGTSGTLGTGIVTGSSTSGPVLAFNRSDAITVPNVIQMRLKVAQQGTGVLTLSGVNTYSEGTTINAGATLAFTNGGLSSSGSITFAGNGSLRWCSGNTEDIASRIAINSGVTGNLDFGDNNVTFASAITTSASVTKTGAGTRKSGTHAAVFAPIQALERDRIEAAREEVAREQCERRQAELRLKKLERLASEGDEVAQQEAREEAARLAQWPEPVLPRLICEDVTEEALIRLLACQDGRILSTSTEGGVFSLMGGRYAKNGDSQFDCYLKAHAGDPIIVDRISREATSITRPAITIAYTVQPDVIQRASENESFRGRGLWARFMYHRALTLVGQRLIAAPPVSSHVKQGYFNIIRHLTETARELVLRPDAEAARVFLAWETEIERMLDSGGAMETMRDWGAKLAGATLRIAAALHCAEFGMVPTIARSTIESAIDIARYLIPHAEYVLNVLTTQEGVIACDAECLLRWMKRQGRPHFTQRDAHRSGGRRYRHVDEVIPALDELQRRGMIRAARGPDRSGPGRSPSPLFEVNPQLLSRSKSSKNADRIDRNPPPPSAAPNSVHSVNHFGMDAPQAPQSATEDWGTV